MVSLPSCFRIQAGGESLPAFQVSLRHARDGKDARMKQHFIPMEVTEETLRDFDLSAYEICWWPVGDRRKLVAMIPATEEEYQAYMRPLWREKKCAGRRCCNESSVEKLREEGNWDKVDDSADIEELVVKEELLSALHTALDDLEEIDRTIAAMYAEGHTEAEIGRAVGMTSQGISGRQRRIFSGLRENLENYF